jgi:cell division septum initiation protein DivIVA|tara:strand:+ start:735 stop:968 length:234 start_codon:yes stop_codon:yes gene_type:complete
MQDYDHAMKINQQHKLINGKLQMQVSNLQFENKKLKNKVMEMAAKIKELEEAPTKAILVTKEKEKNVRTNKEDKTSK